MEASAIRALKSVLGLPCWQVRWDNQVGLDMNFGAPRLEIREPRASTSKSLRVRQLFAQRGVYLKGTHWLVAAPEVWRLRLGDGFEVRRTSSAKRLDIAVARLSGEKLRTLEINARTGATTFRFDLGSTLEVRPPRQLHDDDLELWSLHAPINRYVAVFAGGLYRTGSTKTRDPVARPLDSADNREYLVIGSARGARRLLEAETS